MISRLTRDLVTSYSHHKRQGPESGPLLAARGLENAPLVALAERGPRELHEEQRSPSAQVRLMLVPCACRVESLQVVTLSKQRLLPRAACIAYLECSDPSAAACIA